MRRKNDIFVGIFENIMELTDSELAEYEHS